MNQAAAVIFTETLEKLRAATNATEVRRLAANGLRQLRRGRNLNGSALPRMLRESRDTRIGALNDAGPARHDGVLGDLLRLKATGPTRRECEVLGWIAHGKRDAEIAAILGISKKTVGKHIEHLLFKLHVETRTAAVSVAYERALRCRRSSKALSFRGHGGTESPAIDFAESLLPRHPLQAS